MSTMLFVTLWASLGSDQPTASNRAVGNVLAICAQLGMPPECVRAIFGDPEASQSGRIDWRTNPDRYLKWGYSRYGVWVEWEAGPFARAGTGPIFTDIHGSIE